MLKINNNNFSYIIGVIWAVVNIVIILSGGIEIVRFTSVTPTWILLMYFGGRRGSRRTIGHILIGHWAVMCICIIIAWFLFK